MSRNQISRLILLKLACISLRKIVLSLALSVIVSLIGVASVYCDQVTLEWDPNSEPDLAGYRIYVGYSSGNYQYFADAGNHTSLVFNNGQAGTTYFFVATAYDMSGNESEISNEIKYTFPTVAPAPEPTPSPEPQPTPSPQPQPTPSPQPSQHDKNTHHYYHHRNHGGHR
jgi:hypothetical protein